MSGTTPLKKQAVVCEGRSVRLVTLDEAEELYEENLGAARWLKKFPVHRHDGEHSLIREDGACENCSNGGSCEPVEISAVRIPQKAWTRSRRKWTPATRRTDQEEKTLLRELEDFTPELPKDLRDLINSTPWSDEGLRKLLAVARSRFVELSDVKFEAARTLEPDEGQPLGPSLWADPRGRAAVREALLKGLGKPYDSFEEAARAGNFAQGLKQGRIERAIRELVAEERAGSK